MTMTILEAAATVRQKQIELARDCTELRQKGGDWTGYAIASEDAMHIADDGLRNCRTMLDRIHDMVRKQLSKPEI